MEHWIVSQGRRVTDAERRRIAAAVRDIGVSGTARRFGYSRKTIQRILQKSLQLPLHLSHESTQDDNRERGTDL